MTEPQDLPRGAPDDLDPDIRRFQQQLAADYATFPDLETLPLAEVRRVTEQVRARWTQGGPRMAETTERTVGQLATRIRIHRPEGAAAAAPSMVYMHGGGWTYLSLDTHDRLMREYAARAGIVVVGVDYRLSPEVRFPHAIDQAAETIRWLRENAAEAGLDGARVAIGGDSAGANMAVATCLRLREHGAPPPSAMLLNYGAFDLEHSDSWRRYDGPAYTLNAEEMDQFWDNYLGPDGNRDDPLARPLLADLAGLPPAFLAIAPCDILVDGNRAMAAALRAAGVPVTEREYPGTTHSFLEAMSIARVSNEALDEAAAWLRQRLEQG